MNTMIISLGLFLTACSQKQNSTSEDSSPENNTSENTATGELFIGHSFFKPFAENMDSAISIAGLEPRSQHVVFSGGASGAPQALWENEEKKAEIQEHLDTGEIGLFVMTYEPTYPSTEGYISWIDYALSNNPNTSFVLALPWGDFPAEYSSIEEYSSTWQGGHDTMWDELIQTLQSTYPDNDFSCIPYGQSAAELGTLYFTDSLSDVSSLIGNEQESIFKDQKGHAGDILVDLGTLIWAATLYDIEPSADLLSKSYETDLVGIANDILDGHEEH